MCALEWCFKVCTLEYWDWLANLFGGNVWVFSSIKLIGVIVNEIPCSLTSLLIIVFLYINGDCDWSKSS